MRFFSAMRDIRRRRIIIVQLSSVQCEEAPGRKFETFYYSFDLMTKVIKFNDKEGSVKETVRCKMSLRSRCWCSWGLAGHLFVRHICISALLGQESWPSRKTMHISYEQPKSRKALENQVWNAKVYSSLSMNPVKLNYIWMFHLTGDETRRNTQGSVVVTTNLNERN